MRVRWRAGAMGIVESMPAVQSPLATSERAELAELRRRTRELEQENLFLKRPQRTCQGSSVSERFEFIDAE